MSDEGQIVTAIVIACLITAFVTFVLTVNSYESVYNALLVDCGRAHYDQVTGAFVRGAK